MEENIRISELLKEQIEKSEYPVVGAKVNNEYKNLDELKAHYEKGGLGDVKVKRFLYDVIEDTLSPIREKRKYYEKNIDLVYDILKEGTKKAEKKANETLKKVRKAMLIDYFN